MPAGKDVGAGPLLGGLDLDLSVPADEDLVPADEDLGARMGDLLGASLEEVGTGMGDLLRVSLDGDIVMGDLLSPLLVCLNLSSLHLTSLCLASLKHSFRDLPLHCLLLTRLSFSV